jgi:alpha-L-fucosidase
MKFKILFTWALLAVAISSFGQASYQPTTANLEARHWFANAKYGLFIHWGPFSIPGDGEWVMNNHNITVKNYSRLQKFFNPIAFDAGQWVAMARQAGIKYITLVTRHHDGFSMWDTKYSDFNIMNTPFKRDIVKEMAEACHQQGIKLFLYYSLVDWRRDDYQYWTGRTGKGTGRTTPGEWSNYIRFMENQLTELLTNYGTISGIWFDGYWDQVAENSKDNHVNVDWHMREIYDLIHRLQPQCLVGNNHHLSPLEGEDFQMFEQDIPGENKSGMNAQGISNLPLETCATINNNWGFSLADTTYKSHKQLINLLVKSAGNGGNLLLNIGPMPNGEIQPEFTDRLNWVGGWLKTYGTSVYDTKAGYIRPQNWGCLTQKNDILYVHPLSPVDDTIKLTNVPFKRVIKAYMLKTKEQVKFTLINKTLSLTVQQPTSDDPDKVVALVTQ